MDILDILHEKKIIFRYLRYWANSFAAGDTKGRMYHFETFGIPSSSPFLPHIFQTEVEFKEFLLSF